MAGLHLAGRGRVRVSGPRTPLQGRWCRPVPVPASRRPSASHSVSVRYPGPPASRKACGRPGPMPRRRASIATSISAAARRAVRCGTGPAALGPRPGTGSPPVLCSGGDLAAIIIRGSCTWASWLICTWVNAAGTVMSRPASSSRACACRSSLPAGRAVRTFQNPGHIVASTKTGARTGSRSSSRSPAATRSPSPASAGSR